MKKKRTRLNQPVLAEGETTGHAHRLSPTTEVFVRTTTGVREFDLPVGDVLVHEEHGQAVLPAGQFAADRVLEIDPALEDAAKARRVTD